jgi:hypothetical protein
MKLSLSRILIAAMLLMATATTFAQSALSDQFMNMNPAEREQLMRQFGLSPDDVLGAIRQGAGRAGAAAGGGQSSDGGQQDPGQDPSLGSQQPDFGGMQGFPWLRQQERGPVYDPNDMRLSGSIDYADRYGLEVFSGGNARVQELYSIPVPGDYIVGPGDSFLVSLYGAESMQHYLPVTRDGWIDFPALGPICRWTRRARSLLPGCRSTRSASVSAPRWISSRRCRSRSRARSIVPGSTWCPRWRPWSRSCRWPAASPMSAPCATSASSATASESGSISTSTCSGGATVA